MMLLFWKDWATLLHSEFTQDLAVLKLAIISTWWINFDPASGSREAGTPVLVRNLSGVQVWRNVGAVFDQSPQPAATDLVLFWV